MSIGIRHRLFPWLGEVLTLFQLVKRLHSCTLIFKVITLYPMFSSCPRSPPPYARHVLYSVDLHTYDLGGVAVTKLPVTRSKRARLWRRARGSS